MTKLMNTHTSTEPGEPSNRGKVWAVCEKLSDLFPFDYLCFFCGDAPAKAKWQIGPMLEKLGTDLIRAEKPFRTEVEAAIRAMCAGQSVSTSPEVTYFLALRSRVVFWFFNLICIPNLGGACDTRVPFPEGLSESEVVRCLMLDWFNANGPTIAALLRLEEIHAGLEQPENF